MADLTLADLTSQASSAFALSEDQKRRIAWQQLMALGFGIAGSRDWTGVGRAGLNAMQMGASEEERLQRDKMQAMQVQAAALQNANALRQYNQQGQLNSAWQKSQIPGQPAQPGMPEMGPPDMQGGMQMAVPPKPAQLPGVDFQRVLAEGGPLAAQYLPQAEAQRLKSVRAGAPLMSSPGMPPPGLPAPAGAMGAPGGMQGGPVAPPSTVAPPVPPMGQMQPPSQGAMLMSAINYKFKLADYLARNDDMQGAQAAEASAIELVKSIPGVESTTVRKNPKTGRAGLLMTMKDGTHSFLEDALPTPDTKTIGLGGHTLAYDANQDAPTGMLKHTPTYGEQNSAGQLRLSQQQFEYEKNKPHISATGDVFMPAFGPDGKPAAPTVSQIPGSTAVRKQDMQAQQSVETATRAFDVLDKLEPLISRTTTGKAGYVTSKIPGTEGYDLGAQVDTIKAILSIETLSAMRQVSPTGGAVGNVTEGEHKMLAASIRNLDTAQSEKQLRDAVAGVREHLGNVLRLIQEHNPRVQVPDFSGVPDVQRAYEQGNKTKGSGVVDWGKL